MLRSSISRPKLWRCRAQSLCFAGWDREEATDDNEWREKRKNNNNRVKKMGGKRYWKMEEKNKEGKGATRRKEDRGG